GPQGVLLHGAGRRFVARRRGALRRGARTRGVRRPGAAPADVGKVLVSDSRAPAVVTTHAELARVVRAALAAPLVAVDVEGNGLFAYRPKLCTVQLAWGGDEVEVAIVDTIAVEPKPLGELFAAGGPAKVLHDFTFDVKLLADAGIELANV